MEMMDSTQALITADFSLSNKSSDDADDNILSLKLKKPIARLELISSDDQNGRQFLLYSGKNYVGRDPELQICLGFNPNVSKKHACIEIDCGEHLIFDCNSLNKTMIRNKTLTSGVRYQLDDGMLLKFGDVHCTYVKIKSDARSATSVALSTSDLGAQKSLISNLLANHMADSDEESEADDSPMKLQVPRDHDGSLNKSDAFEPNVNRSDAKSAALVQDTPYFFAENSVTKRTAVALISAASDSFGPAVAGTQGDVSDVSTLALCSGGNEKNEINGNRLADNGKNVVSAEEEIDEPCVKSELPSTLVELNSNSNKKPKGNSKRPAKRKCAQKDFQLENVEDFTANKVAESKKLVRNYTRRLKSAETSSKISTRSSNCKAEGDEKSQEKLTETSTRKPYHQKTYASRSTYPLKSRAIKNDANEDENDLLQTFKQNVELEKNKPKKEGRKRKIFDDTSSMKTGPECSFSSESPAKKQPSKQTRHSHSSPRRAKSSKLEHKIALTGFNEKVVADLTKDVKSLGGIVVDSALDCTVLIAEKVKRTEKLLCSVANGIPILAPEWLKASSKAKEFLDHTKFILKDDDAEKQYNFKLSKSLECAKSRQLFDGFSFFMTPSIKPEPLHMQIIVACAGAKVLTKIPTKRQAGPKTLAISCPEDREYYWDKLKQIGLTLVSPEIVLTGILQQDFDITKYLLAE